MFVTKKVYIYTLINPLNDEIFYVGYTYNIKKRLYEHLYSYNLKDNKYKKSVILKILNNNLKPKIVVVDECDYVFNEKENMYEHEILEIYYIKKYRDVGIKLTNLTDGGKNPPQSKTKRIVYQFDKNLNLIKIHESITAAAISVNTQATHICRVLDQKRGMSCLNYYWMTSDDKNRIRTKKNRNKCRNKNFGGFIPIVQYTLEGDFVREYKGQSEAEKVTKINSKLINKCLRLKGFDQAGGFMWFYKNSMPKEIKKYDGRNFSRKILAYDLNGNFISKYDSIREGAINLNLDETCVCKNLKGIITKTGNYCFSYNK